MAAWAEDVAGRVERTLEMPLPIDRYQSIQIIFREDGGVANGQVLRAQGWSDSRLVQRLILVNKERIGREEVLEGLCRLLANRYAIARQVAPAADPALAELPDWFSVGLAQSLFPELRSRNALRAIDLFQESQISPVSTVLTWRHLPEGRSSNKALCGVFFDWLQEASREVWPAAIHHIAGGGIVTVPWIQSNLAGVASSSDVEMNWVLWVAHQQNIRRLAGAEGGVSYAALDELLEIRLAEYGIQRTGDEWSVLTPRDLAGLWREDWMPGLIARLRPRLQALALGQSPDFQETVKRYLSFFEALSEAAVSPRKTGTYSDLPVQKRLGSLLAKAEERRRSLETRELAREAYLDEMSDAPPPADGPTSDWEWVVRELEREDIAPDSVEEYLDHMERRLQPGATRSSSDPGRGTPARPAEGGLP
jgi:hypothetical protein